MSPALRAHLRLLEATPRERIHTHERQFHDGAQGKRYPNGIPHFMVDEYARLRAKGMTIETIRATMQIGLPTLRRIREMLENRNGTDVSTGTVHGTDRHEAGQPSISDLYDIPRFADAG